MRCQRPSTLRSPALRNSALSLAKAFSIGLKSGLKGRQVEQSRAGCLDYIAHLAALVSG
jgi:hypothetical protein